MQLNTKQLAEKLEISPTTLRANREKYEKYIKMFYRVNKRNDKYGTIIYELEELEENTEMPSYKEYKKFQKDTRIKQTIRNILAQDNRQTGSNIARIIIAQYGSEYTQTTLEKYVRDALNELVANKEYSREDRKWCRLDREHNRYHILDDEKVSLLRSYLNNIHYGLSEEEIYSKYEDGLISKEEMFTQIGECWYYGYIGALRKFKDETGVQPIQVPVYRDLRTGEIIID